jgi:hypothetical protein
VAVSQSSGAQVTVPRFAHVPAPSQVFGFCEIFLALQLAGAQAVPATQGRQAPAPLQLPSRPQLVAGVAVQREWGSGTPLAMAAQLPRKPGTLQAWQAPQEAAAQQTPSTQLLLSHSVPLEQPAPRALRRQMLPAQAAGGAQSAFVAQEVAQAPLRQTKGAQSVLPGAGAQWPAPSQAGAPTTELPAQLPEPHDVPVT